jgi:transcriptional regulator with XRE-family HTH domain
MLARRQNLPPDVEARHQIGVKLRLAREEARRHGVPQPPRVRQEIGEVLRAAREASRLSQRLVAHRLGITPAMVCYMERGMKRVPLQRIDAIAEAYGLEPEQLERPPVVTRDADEAALVTGFRHLSEDERVALLALVRA